LKAGWSILLTALFTLVRAEAPLYERLEELSTAKDFASFVDDKRAISLYQDALRQYFGEENFACEKFDTILSDFKTLSRKVAGVDVKAWKQPSTFPTLKIGEFTVRPLRAVHAMWFDTRAMGCGQTICELADPNAPERWAALLDGAQFFAVEQNGKFTGTTFVMVPVVQETQLRAGLWVKESGSVPKGFTDQWLEKIKPLLPKELSGVSRQLAGTRPVDATSDEIHTALPRRCFGVKESRGENLLAGMPSREPASGQVVNLDFNNPATMQEILGSFQTPDQPGKIANVPVGQTDLLKKNLGSVLISDPNPKRRAKAAQGLGWLGQPPQGSPSSPTSISAASALAPRVPPAEITPLLTPALSDPSPLVRGSAGVGLFDMGSKSPAISQAQAGLFDAANPAAAANKRGLGGPPVVPPDVADLLGRGAGNLLRSGVPLSQAQMDRLFEVGQNLPEGKAKQNIIDAMAKGYLFNPNPAEAMDFISKKLLKDSQLTQAIADKVNAQSCPSDLEFRRAIQSKQAPSDKETEP